MPVRKLVADAIDTWREGERVLRGLPAASGERAAVNAALRETLDLYVLLTKQTGFDDEEIEAARQRLDAVRRAIGEVRSRPGGPLKTDTPEMPAAFGSRKDVTRATPRS